MDFRKIFNSYSSGTNTTERTNVLTQTKNIPGNVSFAINEFISSIIPDSSNDEDNTNESIDNSTPSTENSTIPSTSSDLSDDVWNALSDLDNPIDDNNNESDNNTEEEEEEEENSQTDNDDVILPDFFGTNNLPSSANDQENNLDKDEAFEDIFNDFENLLNSEKENINTENDLIEENLESEFPKDILPNDFPNELPTEDFSDSDITDIDDSILNQDTIEKFDTDSAQPIEKNQIDEIPDIDSSDLDLDLSNLLDDDINNNDFEDISFNEESSNDEELSFDDDDFEFEIENPDDLNQQSEPNIISSEENNVPIENIFDPINISLDRTNDLPDFSSIDSKGVNEIDENLSHDEIPTVYEQQNHNEESFDSWNNETDTDSFLGLNLDEHQIFSIREKINRISDKELRFNIRNIVLDPSYHKEYINQLISLLLIDAPDSKLSEFLEEHLKNNDMNSSDVFAVKEPSFSTFFADDVVRFEEFKNEFAKITQKISVLAFLSLIIGLISWFGIVQPMKVNSLLEKGLKAIHINKYTEAESLFNEAHQIIGKPLPEWFIKYGDAYVDKKMNQMAEQKYLAGITAAPKDKSISIHVADFYTNLGPKYFSNAINIMKNISQIHPKNFEVWDYYGGLYIDYADFFTNDLVKQEELYFKAANIYTEFIRNNPKNIAPYYKMIDIYIKLNNPNQINNIAQLIFSSGAKYLNIDILNKLAEYYIDHRDLNSASKIFKHMIPFVDMFINKIPNLQKILKNTYNTPTTEVSNLLSESYYEFARYKMLSSDIIGSTSLLTNSIIFNPNNDKSYNLLGEAFLVLPQGNENFMEADSLFKKALDINPNSYKPHINLGHLYYYWGQEMPRPVEADNTALYHYRTAKALIPINKDNYLLNYNLGWLEYKNNNYADALDLWSNIYKENPNNPALNYAMGAVLFKQGNPQLAQIKFQETVDGFNNIATNINEIQYQNPRHREIFTQLSKTHNNLGVINANYGLANPNRKDYFNGQALLHFYEAKNYADLLGTLYNMTEYNIGVLTRPNIKNRKTEFDTSVPKQTTLGTLQSEFKTRMLEKI